MDQNPEDDAAQRLQAVTAALQAEVALRRLVLAQSGRLSGELRDEALDAMDLLATEASLRGVAPAEQDPAVLVTLAALRDLMPASERFPADSDLAFLAVAIATHLQVLRPDRLALVTTTLERLSADWPGNITQVKALADHYQRLAAQARKAGASDARERTRRAQAWAQRAVELYPAHLPFREDLIALARENGDSETIERETATIKRLAPIVYPTNRPRGTW